MFTINQYALYMIKTFFFYVQISVLVPEMVWKCLSPEEQWPMPCIKTIQVWKAIKQIVESWIIMLWDFVRLEKCIIWIPQTVKRESIILLIQIPFQSTFRYWICIRGNLQYFVKWWNCCRASNNASLNYTVQKILFKLCIYHT